jgi:hypothetical protein
MTTPNVKRLRKRPRKNDIVWVTPNAATNVALKKIPERYIDPIKTPHSDAVRAKLMMFAPFITIYDMHLIPDGYQFPVLDTGLGKQGKQIRVPAGTIIMYAGNVPAIERVRIGKETKDVDVMKHTFIVPNVGRVIIHSLDAINIV